MIQILIEARAGSREKKRYDEQTLVLKRTRTISHPYPYPYGFIIGTTAQDGDAVDCYLITKNKLETGDIVDCEPIGLLEQFEGEELDHKVLACLPDQPVEITWNSRRNWKILSTRSFPTPQPFPSVWEPFDPKKKQSVIFANI